jgi:hypothetical protein
MAQYFKEGSVPGGLDFYNSNLRVNEVLVEGFTSYYVTLYHNAIAIMVLLTGRSIEGFAGLLVFSMKMLLIMAIHYYARKKLGKQSNWVWFVVAVTALAGSIPNIFGTSGYLFYNYGAGFNIWHNPTTYTVMPFVIITLFMFLESINYSVSSLEGLCRRKNFYLSCVLLSIMLILSVLGKPSWFPPFAVAVIVYLFIYWASDKFSLKRFKDSVVIGISFIPAGSLLIFTSTIINTTYSPELVFGITRYIRPIPIILNLTLPLIVLVLRFRTIKTNRLLQMGWLTYIAALLNGLFIIEVELEGAGNMAWAMLYSSVVLLMVSLIEFVKYIQENHENVKARYIIYIGLTIACIHISSGVFHALLVLGGRSSWF